MLKPPAHVYTKSAVRKCCIQKENKVFTSAAPVMAADIPCAVNLGTILAFPQRCATTTRFKLRGRVEALIITRQARDGACIQAARAGGCACFKGAFLVVSATLVTMISPTVAALTRFGRRMGGGWSRGSRGFMASLDRRIPSPTFGALRRRRVGGRGVAWDTATLLGPPVIASRRAVCALGWGRGSLWWSTFRQTTVLGGPPVLQIIRNFNGGEVIFVLTRIHCYYNSES